MKRVSKHISSPSLLSDSLHRRLNSYAQAAAAAGVGVLAAAHASEAKVIFHHANIQIKVDGGLVDLDLNRDGVNDFQFYNIFSVEGRGHPRTASPTSFSLFAVHPAQATNRVYATDSNGHQCAAALKKNVKVGPKSPFQTGASTLSMAFHDNDGLAYCPWRPIQTSYLGLKFSIKGKNHFGWARVKRLDSHGLGGFPAVITGYAYETKVGKPIRTGQTSGALDGSGNATLGGLASGK